MFSQKMIVFVTPPLISAGRIMLSGFPSVRACVCVSACPFSLPLYFLSRWRYFNETGYSYLVESAGKSDDTETASGSKVNVSK